MTFLTKITTCFTQKQTSNKTIVLHFSYQQFFYLPSVGLQASLTVAPTINILQSSIIQQITESVFEVTLPYFGDVLTDASLAGDDDVVEAHADLPVARLCGLVFGSLAVQFLQILGNTAGVIHESVLLLQAALVKSDGSSWVSEYSVHLGAGRGALAEAPLLTAGPVTHRVCGVLLGQISFYHRGRTSFRTLTTHCRYFFSLNVVKISLLGTLFHSLSWRGYRLLQCSR